MTTEPTPLTDFASDAAGPDPVAEVSPPFEVLAPARQTLPLVFASPHSGRVYPASLLAASRLDPLALRKSEDCFVDEIFAAAPECGAPLIRAHFPRVYIDPNREPFELDPAMFSDALPDYVNIRSPRVASGLGTVARIVADGEPIYRDRLRFAEAARRIATCYRPYHATLARLLRETRQHFGFAILVDCHSMPSVGLPAARGGKPVRGGAAAGKVDTVLGDCFGTACSPAVTERCEALLQGFGYSVARNHPYAGGYTTRHYGRPRDGVHAIQIEINRALYMDERLYERSAHLPVLAAEMRQLILGMADLDLLQLAAE
ncbi:N-formylglutamate amidohydrolase [Oceanibaculum pacificum]|uniref:N-formylglutamate amidohydrolase n=1 Tax=Oceanibaculum pacificum TaxID=580166 RepID=UPI000A031A27|nr:N-formylglutamate amidohydrolase [Oceanibaculum pacificum]